MVDALARLTRTVRAARLPRPVLTGLGCGVLTGAAMVAVGWLSRLAGGVPTLHGVVFLLACLTVALMVRPADLICAPVAAPIAFALGAVAAEGFDDLPATLAFGAPWLFSGTLLAVVIVLVRGAARTLRRRRAAARR
ncbi:DUF6542 domain-containing protein [Streptomyces sp. ST2-7A]|uniref:DUF6542 domain-containing protein n=1 Tax=Streptomyces sp. ST2-7A TaxID=2907214 RepID=UPI001F25A5EF|nr:DUF6542 domain-containing protein [Streptomyces sp. ST2-7A]MCE7082131.1 hypothetical protein [Streptomyces sp. ST2-7A]